MQLMRSRVPAIKVSDNRNLARIRRPDAETRALLVSSRHEMSTQLLVGAIISALIEEMKVVRREQSHISANCRSLYVRYHCSV